MTSYSIVQKMIPARVLTEIGIYLQTAAHLEMAIWQIVMALHGTKKLSHVDFVGTLESKNVTQKLVASLKRSHQKAEPRYAFRILALAAKIEAGLANRNLVAHGAFFLDGNDEVRVAHYFPQGKKENRKWYEFNQKLSRRSISEALSEIDALLREAIDIRNGVVLLSNKKDRCLTCGFPGINLIILRQRPELSIGVHLSLTSIFSVRCSATSPLAFPPPRAHLGVTGSDNRGFCGAPLMSAGA